MGYIIAFGLYIAVILAGAIGWVMNIIAIVHSTFDPLTPVLVLRIVGVLLAPLGAVMGYV